MNDADNATLDANQPAKKRGRPKGVPNKPKAPTADGEVSADHNENKKPRAKKTEAPRQPSVGKEPLNDEQEHALTALHTKNYQRALERKKTADAEFKNTCKLAKAEGVGLKQIKEYIDYQTEEGQERLKEDLARKQKVARWAGLPVGTQLNFLEDDRTPIDERTRDDGKRAGLKGEKGEPPRHLPGNLISAWMEGWHEGQRILGERIKHNSEEQRAEDAKEFDDELPASTEADADAEANA